MKAKRKEVNKFRVKESKSTQDDDDLLRRTSGTKPFQLNKLRMTKRISEWTHIPPLSNRNQADYNECYIDLVINKKLIVKEEALLPPDKRNTYYLNYEAQVKKQLSQVKSISIDESSVDLPPNNSEVKEGGEVGDKLNEIISHKTELQQQEVLQQKLETDNIKKSVPQSMTLYDRGQSVIVPQKSMRFRDKAALPPFSFTHHKWRSKSELVGVDKWKAKYGKPQHSSSMKQLKDPNNQANKFPTQSDIQRFIEYKKRTQDYRSPRKSKPKLQPVLSPSLQPLTTQNQKKQNNQQSPPKESSEKTGNTANVLHSQNDIVIRKMFGNEEKDEIIEQDKAKKDQTEERAQQGQQSAKKKNRKYGFPEIKISKFSKSKEEGESQRNKPSMMYRTNWQQRTRPKKAYLQNQMEQIPERWELAQSRQKCTDEEVDVDAYIKIKKEEEKDKEREGLKAIEQAAEVEQDIVAEETVQIGPIIKIREIEQQLVVDKRQ